METLMMLLVFSSSAVVAGALVVAFTKPIDHVLPKLLTDELAEAWSKVAKFGLFVATFAGGIRLSDLQSYAADKGPITASQCLVEVYRTLIGSMESGAWGLVAFFGIAIVLNAIRYGYHELRPQYRQSEERRVPSGRY